MKRSLLAIAAMVIGIGVVAAQSDSIKKRNSLMASIWKDGLSSPYRMANGKEAFDKAKAEASLAKMEEIVVQLPPLWPPNSKPPAKPDTKYSSSLKVWDNKPDFEAKLAKLTKSIKESRGKVTDLDSLKGIANTLNQDCNNCHDTYQVRN